MERDLKLLTILPNESDVRTLASNNDELRKMGEHT